MRLAQVHIPNSILVRTSWYITPLYITVYPSKLQYDIMLHSLLPKSTVSLLVYHTTVYHLLLGSTVPQYTPVYYSIPYCVLFWVLLYRSTPQYITVYHTAFSSTIIYCILVYPSILQYTMLHFHLPGPGHAAEGPGVEAAGASDPLQ